MNLLLQAAAELQVFCDKRKWAMCFIGGLAVQRWGEPRFTKDADITLLTGFGEEASYIDELLRVYSARVPDAKQFAIRNRVLILASEDDVPIDIALGALPFEEHAIERASRFQYAPKCRLNTCSAEDLIIHKAFANRPQDWLDIESILVRQQKSVDLKLIWSEILPLAELKDEISILESLRARVKSVLGAREAAKLK